MKSHLVTAIVASVLAVLGCWLYQRAFTDRWQPTGDGKTIVNVRTGELRVARTGEVILPPPVVDAEKWREIAIENGKHFNAAQALILTMPEKESGEVSMYTGGGWYTADNPFEHDKFPTEFERDVLMEGIASGLRHGVVKGTRWQELYDHLAALNYGCPPGAEPMIRTPDQERESREVMLGIRKGN